MIQTIKKLVRLVKFILKNSEVREDGSFYLTGDGYLITASSEGIKIVSENLVQLNGSKLLFNCSADYLEQVYAQEETESNCAAHQSESTDITCDRETQTEARLNR